MAYLLDTVSKYNIGGITDCVVNVEDYKKGRKVFPCGDGCDHKLNEKQEEEVKKLISKFNY